MGEERSCNEQLQLVLESGSLTPNPSPEGRGELKQYLVASGDSPPIARRNTAPTMIPRSP